jgi:ATP phosphoribosyltransferase regulatory subunit
MIENQASTWYRRAAMNEASSRIDSLTATGAAPDARALALLARFERAGYMVANPPVLQPAEPFLDLSGEDIRRRMFLTTDPEGHELCLRPDLTIPVAREYLASDAAGRPAGYCYLGPVFRFRREGPPEFMQAGIESFGREDTAAADAELLALALEAAAHYGVAEPEIRLGDVGLFAAFISAIDLPASWKRRLVKDFNRAETLAHDLDQLTAGAGVTAEYQGVLAALAGADPRGAHALVTDLLSIAGISTVGGRSVDEIADRFLDHAALAAGTRLSNDVRGLIKRFLSVAGNPDDAVAIVRDIAQEGGLDIEHALRLFETRTGFLAARGVDVSRIRFSTAYGREFDYYTGFVFALREPSGTADLVTGGRYDGMLARLGSANTIPAVGFSLWSERLAAAGAAQ